MVRSSRFALRGRPAALVLAASLPCGAAPALAQLPPDFVDQYVLYGLQEPVAMDFLRDGRLVVVERDSAKIRLLVNGALAADDPVGVVDSVRSAYGEQGLIGVAVDPGWPARPYLYVQYDYLLAPVIRISRYTASGDLAFTGNGSFTVDPASRYDLLVDLPDNSLVHNGGGLRFGPDGMLYSSLGDDANACKAQDLTQLQGKILRLDVSNLPPGPGGPPALSLLTPPDNPFVSHPDERARLVYHYGLRNPARFHIDPGTGDLFMADVGTTEYEEIDWSPTAGANFEWPFYEGPYRQAMFNCPGADTTGFTDPIYYFSRCDEGCEQGASIISAGVFHRPPSVSQTFPPEYEGDYFFTDYYRRFLRRLKRTGNTWNIAPPVPGQPTDTTWGYTVGLTPDLMFGPDGALYYLVSWIYYPLPNTGAVKRIVYTGVVSASVGEARELFFAAPYPSPARSEVWFEASVPAGAAAELRIHDAQGRLAGRPAPVGGSQGGGRLRLRWDGRDARGRPAPAGVYFARLEAAGRAIVRRFVRLP